MRAKPRVTIMVLIALPLWSSCLSEVHTGRNGIPPTEDRESESTSGGPRQERSPEVPPEDGFDGHGEPGAQDRGESEGRDCWGESPESKWLTAFCAAFPVGVLPYHRSIHQLMCVDGRLGHTLSTGCSWDGRGSAARYRAILAMTPITHHHETSFRFFAASAVRAKGGLASFAQQNRLLYRDLGRYRQTWLPLRGIRIDESRDLAEGGVVFRFRIDRLNSHVGFRGEYHEVPFSERHVAMFIHGTGEFVRATAYAQLIVAHEVQPGELRIMTISDQAMHDGGNHRISFDLAQDLELEKMRGFILNAPRTEN